MATFESSTDMSKYRLKYDDWNLSDDELIAKIKEIIRALKNHEVDAASVLQEIYLGDANAAIHIFGNNGYNFCKPELIVTWLSLLVLLASSENITGGSIAEGFTKSCGGCMVYTILMVVACFRKEEITRLAFDFFRHVSADSTGNIFTINEIDQIALLLNKLIGGPQDGTHIRSVCLAIRHFPDCADPTTAKGRLAVQLSDLIEGLGALCTSGSSTSRMKAISTLITEILNETRGVPMGDLWGRGGPPILENFVFPAGQFMNIFGKF
ncbi:unnamed protein product [Adineta steineri]|uniref:Uncharacterized protein n=1 Tax=Adineta steineri TaxID=433720 RepID=A0A815R2K8_9BILA|nr:unnamed protein product [Adineta steineri]CAF3995565.1 unnamed protein product [Adineta steineri]